jgi:hypothetical protein
MVVSIVVYGRIIVGANTMYVVLIIVNDSATEPWFTRLRFLNPRIILNPGRDTPRRRRHACRANFQT